MQSAEDEEEISRLQSQLQSVAMDQLYVAFYPTDTKYMALFANGNERVVDDERGQRRRRGVWTKIREGLLAELKEQKKGEKEEGGNESDDSSSVPSDSSDSEGEDPAKKKKQVRLSDAKGWVNLDAAKRALLSMPDDTYPNGPSSMDRVPAAVTVAGSKRADESTASAKKEGESGEARTSRKEKKAAAAANASGAASKATAADSRFALSKDLDGMFGESTTGDDYHKELEKKDGGGEGSESSSDDDSDSTSGEDDADPLKGFGGKKEVVAPNASKDTAKKGDKSSSSSSSSSSEDSSSDSDSSDSESDAEPKPNSNQKRRPEPEPAEDGDSDEEEEDDFFASSDTKVSAKDIFARVQNERKENRSRGGRGGGEEDASFGQRRKPDKSRGFKSQNQSRREYRAFQHRQKRQKFG